MIAIRKLYHTGQDNRSGWSPSATLQHYGKTAGVHTFYWNGTPTGESYDTNYLPEGTYTFEVTANQADENLCLNCNGIPPEPPCTAGDKETYRSEYLKIVRASDESGNPICDVEYDGYDDNGTPEDESDDKYIYIIRKYVLKDSLGMNASEGVIWLYDPEGEMVHDWNIANEDCITHNDTDGLHATADGIEHALRIRVPVEKMPYAGTYRFVLHIKDDHGGLYRNGVDRWALDLNAAVSGPAVCMYHGYDVMTAGIKAAWEWARKHHVLMGSPPNRKWHRIVAGEHKKYGKWKALVEPTDEHASTVVTALWGGGGKDSAGRRVPPLVWLLQAHGAGAPYTSKAMVIHKGLTHKCAVAADHSVSLPGYETAYISDLPPLEGVELVILAGCKTGRMDGGSGMTLGKALRQKGVAHVLATSREISNKMLDLWIKKFFEA